MWHNIVKIDCQGILSTFTSLNDFLLSEKIYWEDN